MMKGKNQLFFVFSKTPPNNYVLRFNTIPVLVLDADKTLEDIIELYKKNENKILGNFSI